MCRSGRKPIPGLVYSQKVPGIAQRQRWIAADVEAAVTCPELAIALRHFDSAGALGLCAGGPPRTASGQAYPGPGQTARACACLLAVPGRWRACRPPRGLSHQLLGYHYALSYNYTRTCIGC